MADPNDVDDQPAPDQNTPDQPTPEQQNQTVMGILMGMQQAMNDDRATMRQSRDNVTRQLADPLAHIGSFTASRRAPTVGPGQHFEVSIYPPFDPSNPEDFDQRVDGWLRCYSPDQLNRISTRVASQIHTLTGMPPQVPGGEGVPGPPRDVDQNRLSDSDNAKLQRLRRFDLENRKRIKELEDALKKAQAHQAQTTTPYTQNPARRPNRVQRLNSSGQPESSRDAQRRAEQRSVSPEPPATPPAGDENDAEVARRWQIHEYGKERPDEDLLDVAPNESLVPVVGPQDQISEEDDQSHQEMNAEPVQNKRKRNKGKRPQIDATDDVSSRAEPAKSQAPSAVDPDPVDDEPLASTEQTDTGDAATQAEQILRKSRRQEAKRNNKTQKPDVKQQPSKPTERYRDPETGQEFPGYARLDHEPEKKTILPPDPEPSRRKSKNVQTSTTSKAQSNTGAGADQATNAPETQALIGRSQDNAGSDGTEDQDMSHESNQFGEDIVARAPEEEEDLGNWQDENEAKNPEDAHRFSNRPKRIHKHNDGHRPTTGYGSRHGRSATSWIERRPNDDNNNENDPARTGEKRKSESPSQAAESDGEDEEEIRQSPEKKQKPNNAKSTPAPKNKKKK